MPHSPDQQALLEQYVKKILAAPVYDIAVRTPLQAAPALSDALGNRVLLKREDLQPTFSFKIRGAYNKLVQLSEEQKARGVITASAGNHAQGVALAARELGITATIVCRPPRLNSRYKACAVVVPKRCCMARVFPSHWLMRCNWPSSADAPSCRHSMIPR